MGMFALLDIQLRLTLAGLVFIASLGFLALCLYRFSCTGRIAGSIGYGIIFIVLLIFVSFSAAGESLPAAGGLPWIIYPIIAAAAAVFSIRGIYREYVRSRSMLSPDSVREAIDRFDFGLCFADEKGRIILINRTMNQLSYRMIMRYPQTLEELESALMKYPEGLINTGGGDVFRFADGSIWKFSSVSLSDPGLKGFTQLSALDVTDIYNTNEQLISENRKIQDVIQKMKGMIERMSELAKQQEALNLKIQIHNDIGSSLITLSELAERSGSTDAQTQIAVLRKALSYFSRKQDDGGDGMGQIMHFAKECGVKLDFDGEIPQNKTASDLLYAALRECITNCVKHAGGDNVKVKTGTTSGCTEITVTNNGKKPEGPVVEGGGLTSLRRKVEQAGALMTLEHEPEFKLKLVIPEE